MEELMPIQERRSSILSIAACSLAGAATACSGNAQPGSGSPGSEIHPLSVEAMPVRIVDPGGQVWEKVGAIKYSDSKIQDPNTPSTGDPNANLSVEQLAARIRPKMDTNGVEYSLSWTDTLALAAEMRKPLTGPGQAAGGGPNGAPAPVDSGGLEGRTKGISGNDDRSQVFSSSYPWNNVGAYQGPEQCTAFKLINNFTAITAGHCVLDGNNNWRSGGSITFAAGTSGALATLPWCYPRVTLGDSGTNTSDDFAVIQLRGNGAWCDFNSYNVGWLGWQTRGACDSGFGLNTPGYPSMNPPWGAPPPGNWSYPTMFSEFDSAHIDCIVNQNVLWFNGEFSPGESGGPAWWFDGSTRYVNGIMTKGHDGDSNEALRFDSRVIGFFNSNAGS
jgi:hypothetical protein